MKKAASRPTRDCPTTNIEALIKLQRSRAVADLLDLRCGLRGVRGRHHRDAAYISVDGTCFGMDPRAELFQAGEALKAADHHITRCLAHLGYHDTPEVTFDAD